METIVCIAESDYDAVMQWDDDGGNSVNIVYQLIPDSQREPTSAMAQNILKDSEENSTKSLNCEEAILMVKT